ncbi:sensor histidine kinase [Kitasatospora xanthocidica]|uniref:sensor histidine kinase n=1 Tax=Kitasatospora xanthocidica TaxID=83382 RepID=UPI00216AE5D8|nr:sensor histidine kinase [Kitasatospora xanthocidica]
MSSPQTPAAREPDTAEPGRGAARELRAAVRALGRLAAFTLLIPVGVGLTAVFLLSFVIWGCLGIFPFFPTATRMVRSAAGAARWAAGHWSQVPVPPPYRPRPALERTLHGWYWTGHDYHRNRWFAGMSLDVRWLWTDPATWRDVLWVLADPLVGGGIAAAPVLLVGAGLYGVVQAPLPYDLPFGGPVALLLGLLGPVSIAAGLALARPALRLHGRWTRALLGPTERSRLARRVEQLTEIRLDATEAQAAELRRIERDLHDGAQARLVAVSLRLGAVAALVDRDPGQAKQVATDAQENVTQALQELRDLVRGIHPPVLAERGLAEGVRALALDVPLKVEVRAELPGRAEAPVESAVYFAVSEALTNAVKHGEARHATVHLTHAAGLLRAEVTDDGRGGADPDGGSGLRGIRRRLAAFDGTLTLTSPPGGPTRLIMELPCVLSSPRTSSC